jgi:hypothetical protein
MPAATLSQTEFDAVWSALGLGAVPFPLAGPAGERPIDGTVPDVFAGLADRGLAVGGRLHEEWVDCLGVLAAPQRSVDAVGGIGHRLAALAASAHGVAALAVRERGSVVVAPIREGSLVESVVALLPGVPAGPGHPLAVPMPAVYRYLSDDGTDESGRHGDRSADRRALTEAGVAMADATLLVNLAEDRLRGGQFGVNVADPASGALLRAIPVVSWFDTGDGRYLMTNDGVTLAIAPADSAQIAVRLREVMEAYR